MTIEPLEPLKIKLPGGEIRELTPGTLVELPDEQAHRLLAKAPGRVRVVETPPSPEVRRKEIGVSDGFRNAPDDDPTPRKPHDP